MRAGFTDSMHQMSQSMPQLPSLSLNGRPMSPAMLNRKAVPGSPQVVRILRTPELPPAPRTPQEQMRQRIKAAQAARATEIADHQLLERRQHREIHGGHEDDALEGAFTKSSSSASPARSPSNQAVSLPAPGGQRHTLLQNNGGSRQSNRSSSAGRSSMRLGSKQRISQSLERINTWVRNSRMMNSQVQLDSKAASSRGSRWSRLSRSSTWSKLSGKAGVPAEPIQLEQETHAVARSRQPSKHLNMGLPAVTEGFENLGDFVKYHRSSWDAATKRGPLSEAIAEADEAIDEDEEDNTVPVLSLDEMKSWDTKEAASQLHEAAYNNDAIQVWRLVNAADPQSRVPPDILDEVGETAAVRAARGARVATVTALLDARADPLARDTDTRFFNDGIWPDEAKPDHVGIEGSGMPPERCGRTVVYHLRLKGVLEEVLSRVFPMTRLAIMRAVSDALEAFHLTPALIFAANAGNSELMGLLLTHTVARSDRQRQMELPPTPSSTGLSHLSGFSRSTSEMTWSLPPADERAEALLVAVTRNNWKCVRVLLSNGVPRYDINLRRDKQGRTALHLASMMAEPELVRMLLEASSSPATCSKKGRQPIHDATAMGKLEVVQILLDFRANPSEKVKEMGVKGSPLFSAKDHGCTPLDLAQRYGRDKIHELLLQCTLDQ